MDQNKLTPLEAVASGVAGACALTLLHETVRRVLPDAPRMDVLGMRAIAKSMRKADQQPPDDKELHQWAMVGDIISNSLYYSLTGIGSSKHVWLRGAALGLGAGIGGVLLPGPLGLGTKPSARTFSTQLMTVAWYTVGGIAAAAVAQLLVSGRKDTAGPDKVKLHYDR
jgi:hypothetical protein